jgi:hypothetical protein
MLLACQSLTKYKGVVEDVKPRPTEEEEAESIEEESRLRWAVEKAFIPPPWLKFRREGPEKARASRKLEYATKEELKVKISGNPSLFKDLCALAFKLAERGYLARVRVIRVRDLGPAELLPPFLLKGLGDRIARLELEVARG